MGFEPRVREGFEWINAYSPVDYEIFWSLDGSPRAKEWKPIKVRRVRADRRQQFLRSDFPWLGSHALIMRQRAIDALRSLLEAHGEILPLATDDGVPLWVLNVTRVVDAIDLAKSSIKYFAGTERIMRVERAVLDGEAIRGLDIFRLPHRTSPTYVSGRFVNNVESAQLQGLEFLPITVEPS